MRVLLIDDSKPVRMIARLGLSRLGQVDRLEIARSAHPDAILLDVNMPGLGGRETLTALRADPSTKDIPVVFLTAEESRSETDSLRRLGALAVLAKPFDPRTLFAQLQAYLAVAA